MINIQNLIFDLDDTILDFRKGEHTGLTKVFRDHSPTHLIFEDWLKTFRKVNRGIWTQIEAGAHAKELLDTRFSKTYKLFGVEVEGKQLEQEYRSYLDESYFILEGAQEMLYRLRKENFKLIAGTNGTASTQRKRLEGTGLLHYFDDIIISEEIGHAKPSKVFFDHLFDRHKGMAPDNTVMIGDSLRSDIQGAINAGLTNIWFNPSEIKNDTSIKPDHEVPTFEEMEKLITFNKLE